MNISLATCKHTNKIQTRCAQDTHKLYTTTYKHSNKLYLHEAQQHIALVKRFINFLFSQRVAHTHTYAPLPTPTPPLYTRFKYILCNFSIFFFLPFHFTLVLADSFRVCSIEANKLQINLLFTRCHNESFLRQPTTGTASYKHTHTNKHTAKALYKISLVPLLLSSYISDFPQFFSIFDFG